ncbi:UNKNOWN [Stylonychia lemnae]|uniref:Mitochondrial import inner membrane translocase subunit TIM22 n=1 Tax=Stylonychia lemnae TaxID=5949 RepID=A0A078B1Q4_STYLE|nr:UNKNOWN [Stylonychia lemnae]|eukprot:CDW87203.1 UNKNOWN [Stylonychia lemnae]
MDKSKYQEIDKMFSQSSISRYTGFHDYRNIFLEPQFNLQDPFTEKMLKETALKLFAKVALITVASAGFGVAMGLIMSSFETNNAQIVDNTRSTRSQLKQHFHGYGRFLKRQALHFSKFGLYISLLELPIEIIMGRVNTPGIFFSGGMAAVLCNPRGSVSSMFSTFMGSGAFIGLIGLYMNKGNDK